MNSESENFEHWLIAVDAPISESLTYRCPKALQATIKPGNLVQVPLGKRKARGVALRATEKPANNEMVIKEIEGIDQEFASLPGHFLSFLNWMADYYIHPVGSVMSLAYPPLDKEKKPRSSKRAAVVPQIASSSPLQLTAEQQKVVDAINKEKNFSTHLVFGVTGSGKTEVYLQILQQVLQDGKKGLVLVPEISLTPQLVHRFAGRFGDRIAVLHSQLTDRERTNQWWQIVEGHKDILIGARSALFCPIENLGIIIVDEEHEPSFKQDEKLKYNGRDAAIMLGKYSNCPVILGSATPSLESWNNALSEKYKLHQISKRVENRPLPDIQVIDLRQTKAAPETPSWLSQPLYQALQESLDRGDQAALFLNRRGMAPTLLCGSCGYTHECPNCDISLTLHGRSHLVCHYCDYNEDLKLSCPSCPDGEIKPVGLGTEQVEVDIARLFPNARIARADRDEIQSRADLEELISKMEKGEIDVLIGTQMIAKGLDFPKLNLVGLVMADIGFNLPDFRATERSFQLITQVSGRAGRHVGIDQSPGQVIIQTYNPDHPSITYAKKNSFVEFATFELTERSGLNYPPIGRLISIRIQGLNLNVVEESARLLAQRASNLKTRDPAYTTVDVLGPAPAPIFKVRNQFRYHILLKGGSSAEINRFCRRVLGDQKWLPAGVRILVDVDPINLL